MGRRLRPSAAGDAGQWNLGAMWRGLLKKDSRTMVPDTFFWPDSRRREAKAEETRS